jgi:hypothetical protein
MSKMFDGAKLTRSLSTAVDAAGIGIVVTTVRVAPAMTMGVRLCRRGMTRSKRGQGTSEERGALDWHWTRPPQSAHLCLPQHSLPTYKSNPE